MPAENGKRLLEVVAIAVVEGEQDAAVPGVFFLP